MFHDFYTTLSIYFTSILFFYAISDMPVLISKKSSNLLRSIKYFLNINVYKIPHDYRTIIIIN